MEVLVNKMVGNIIEGDYVNIRIFRLKDGVVVTLGRMLRDEKRRFYYCLLIPGEHPIVKYGENLRPLVKTIRLELAKVRNKDLSKVIDRMSGSVMPDPDGQYPLGNSGDIILKTGNSV